MTKTANNTIEITANAAKIHVQNALYGRNNTKNEVTKALYSGQLQAYANLLGQKTFDEICDGYHAGMAYDVLREAYHTTLDRVAAIDACCDRFGVAKTRLGVARFNSKVWNDSMAEAFNERTH